MMHPIGRDGLLKTFLSITDKPQSGTLYSVRAATKTHGPAMRFVGKSGKLGSIHSSDSRGRIRPAGQRPLLRSIFLLVRGQTHFRAVQRCGRSESAKTHAHAKTGFLDPFRSHAGTCRKSRPLFALFVRLFRDGASAAFTFFTLSPRSRKRLQMWPALPKAAAFAMSRAKENMCFLSWTAAC